MSNRITQWCRPLRMSASQKAVLMCIADFAHDDGTDWHSIASIMAWTCLKKTAVLTALRWLEDEGLLVVERGKGVNNRNFLQVDRLQSAWSACQAELDAKATAKRAPTGAPREPVRKADQSATRTTTSPSGEPTGPSGEQSSPPGAPEALEASQSTIEATEVATSVASSTPADAESKPRRVKKSSPSKAKKPANEKKPKADSGPTWDAYTAAYQAKYQTEPLRHALANTQMANFIGKVGAVDAPAIAAFYVGHPGSYYCRVMHTPGALLKDADQLRTQWATGTYAPDGPPDRVSAAERRVAEMLPGLASPELRARLGQQRRQQHVFEDVPYREELPDGN